MGESAGLAFTTENFTDETTFLLKMSLPGKAGLLLAITTSFLIGWITKVLIYKHIFRTKIEEQPINILILIEQVLQHYTGNFLLLTIALSLLLNESISNLAEASTGNQVNGEMFCWLFYYTQAINSGISLMDGLAIAIVRIVYLLKGTWMKYNFGEIRFILGVGIITTLALAILTYLFSSENIASRSAFNVCMGHTQAYEV